MIDIYEAWVDLGIDGFRIDTVKHVNMEFWQQFAPALAARGRRDGNDDFFMFGEVYDADPAFMSPLHHRGPAARRRSTSASRRGRGFAAGRPDAASCATCSPATTTTPTPTPTPTRCRPSSATTTWAASAYFLAATPGAGDELLRARPARPRADVPHPRPAGRLLRRRAGLHRRRRRQGRPAGHVRQRRSPTYNDDDLIGTDAHDGRRQLRHRRTRSTGTSPTWPSCARRTRRWPTAPRSHRYASSGAGVYAFCRIDADEQRRVPRRRQQRDDRADGRPCATVRPRTARSRGSVAGAARHGCTPTTRPGHRHRAAAVRGRLRRGRQRRAAPADAPPMLVRTPRPPERHRRRPGRGRRRRCRTAASTRSPSRGARSATTPGSALGTDDNAPYRVFHDVGELAARHAVLEYRAVAADQQRQPVGDLDLARPSGDPRRRRARRSRRPGRAAGRRDACPAATTPRSAARATGSPTCDQAAADARRRRPGRGPSTVTLPGGRLRATRPRSTRRGTRTTARARVRTAPNIPLDLADRTAT